MRTGRTRATLALTLALMATWGGAWLEGQETTPRSWTGRPLAEALQALQERGVKVIFSSDLVRPDMKVVSQPTETAPHLILKELLAPHGLEAQIGPGGTALVVRREEVPIIVSIETPSYGEPVFGVTDFAAHISAEEEIRRVEFFVDGQPTGVLTRPPWKVKVDVGEENIDREFKVVAYGQFGGVGEYSIKTRQVEILDEVDIALKQTFVTATRGGERVLDLVREDFRVRDDGERVELVTFERGDVPLTAVLLLDASESMRGRFLQAALDGSRAFLSRMRPLDEAMVMLFSDRTLAATEFSSDKEQLLAELDGTLARGGTALNDHLYASLRLLDGIQGRRVVVLFSDGADVQSVLRMQDVLWKVQRSDALIYWIRLQSEERSLTSAWRDSDANEAEWHGLEQAVKQSGGRVAELASIHEIEAAFEEIMDELRGQYVLGYYPPNRRADGTWRDVKVDLKGALGVRLRFRDGYIDY